MAKEGAEPGSAQGISQSHGRVQVEQVEGGRMCQDTVSFEYDSPIASSLSLFCRLSCFQYLTQGAWKQDRDSSCIGSTLLKGCLAKAGAIINPSAPIPPTSCASSSSSAAQTLQALGTDYCGFEAQS